MNQSNLYILAGCNGAGKTSSAPGILSEIPNSGDFINADEIAMNLTPQDPFASAIEAGKIMLNKIDELIASKIDFTFETTLASKNFARRISKAMKIGYKINLIFYWLNSPELALERVRTRVQQGGHYVPPEVIVRRYHSGIKNLFDLYIPVCDYWVIFDNSGTTSEKVAEGYYQRIIDIKKINTFAFIKEQYENAKREY